MEISPAADSGKRQALRFLCKKIPRQTHHDQDRSSALGGSVSRGRNRGEDVDGAEKERDFRKFTSGEIIKFKVYKRLVADLLGPRATERLPSMD